MKKLTTFALIAMLASQAFAHSNVDTTKPENGATVSEVPSEINFNFADDIRLTKVSMIHQEADSVTLDLGDHTSFGREFTLPIQSMGKGSYRIEWRGLGADGHAMRGEFTFTVD
ncbi:copper resistance CopC family protein [Cognatishimia activa]|uniref:Copper resistance protein C n=1 Tax=Cognatishimia activa TaxID=1715691 RepID=A0A0P1ITZ5_9RHOB|nr:copper resistance CopC family protein [Cognatishimia activa]CUJ38113.1 Copper resistance protein C precursor [Cognatishimia activa]CUK26943.1 Copper resistance protein C precursor [Cognatishimia activa]